MITQLLYGTFIIARANINRTAHSECKCEIEMQSVLSMCAISRNFLPASVGAQIKLTVRFSLSFILILFFRVRYGLPCYRRRWSACDMNWQSDEYTRNRTTVYSSLRLPTLPHSYRIVVDSNVWFYKWWAPLLCDPFFLACLPVFLFVSFNSSISVSVIADCYDYAFLVNFYLLAFDEWYTI